MSFQAVTWAIDQKTGSPSAKAVLWSIANYANEQWCAWPFQETIAEDSEQSTDSVSRRISELVGGGLLRRIKLKRFGRRTHDFLILPRSPLFSAPLEEIRPHIPSGCDVMEDAAADSGSVQKLESARSQNESDANESASCGSVSDPTLPQSAVDATALVREPIEPVTNQDSLPQTPSQASGEAEGRAKEEVAADSGFEDWLQKFKTTYPIPDSHPERTREEAQRLTPQQREQALHGATGAAEFRRRNPKSTIVGQLRYMRSSALWGEYARFAPVQRTAPPPRAWVAFGSDEWRARCVIATIMGEEPPTWRNDPVHGKGADFLGALPPAGLSLSDYANAAGEVNRCDWPLLFAPDWRHGMPRLPAVDRDRPKIAAWSERLRECIGKPLPQPKLEKYDLGVTHIIAGQEVVSKWVPGYRLPDEWPPPKGKSLATERELDELSKTG